MMAAVATAEVPATEAVIVSLLAQVATSLYVVVATPLTVVTGLVMDALLLPTQPEVNATEIGTVAGAPLTSTGTLTVEEP